MTLTQRNIGKSANRTLGFISVLPDRCPCHTLERMAALTTRVAMLGSFVLNVSFEKRSALAMLCKKGLAS